MDTELITISRADDDDFEPGSPININEAKKLCSQRAKGNEFFAVVLKKNEKMKMEILFGMMPMSMHC